MRGSYTTKILTKGVKIRNVADILGHGNIETNENYYIYSKEDSRKEATEMFDSSMKSKKLMKKASIKSYKKGFLNC